MNFTPDLKASNSSDRCCDVPVPADADESPPGLARLASSTSFSVLWGLAWLTISTTGLVPISVTGANDFSGS